MKMLKSGFSSLVGVFFLQTLVTLLTLSNLSLSLSKKELLGLLSYNFLTAFS